MTPQDFLDTMINPGLAVLDALGGPNPSLEARRELLAIALQESGPQLDARYQNSPSSSPGPARGWWQFEQGGGVAGVLQHSRSKDLAARCCQEFTIVSQPAAVWRALEGHNLLALCFARLLLWTDPQSLPTTQQAGWDCYQRNWRPGKPHPDKWPGNWQTAEASCRTGG